MSIRKSVMRLILGGGAAALLLAGAAMAQVKAPSFTGHGPVTPPEDPNMCMARNVMNPNKWQICGVTPPKNRDITVANGGFVIVKARFTTPGGTDVTKTIAGTQNATVPILANENATIAVDGIGFGPTHICTVHSADHGSGNILITVSVSGITTKCIIAP